MIKKAIIRGVASYSRTGVTFDDLQKVNIIFGSNGTGKTSASRVLEYGYAQGSYQLPDGTTVVRPWKYPSCEIDWEGQPVRVLVYNKDFRENNLRPSASGLHALENQILRELEEDFDYDDDGEYYTPQNRIEKEIENILFHIREHLWKEVYQPVKDQKDQLKGYNRKLSFANRIRQLLKYKHEDKAKWDATDKFWQQLALQSEALVSSAETEIASLNVALKEYERSGKRPLAMVRLDMDEINQDLDTLSEGEATMITFRFFMQMVDRVEGRKVVVIDDPISSLDYAAIEQVSTLTNSLIRRARQGNDGIEQVIVLTHNSAYHKCLSVNQPRKNTSYWRLYKKGGVSRVTAYGKDNPVRGYYEELWMKLREEKENINVMRRIIETYFLQYGGMDRSQLHSPEYTLLFTDDKKNTKSFSCYQEAFKALFTNLGHEAHYKMMMRL